MYIFFEILIGNFYLYNAERQPYSSSKPNEIDVDLHYHWYQCALARTFFFVSKKNLLDTKTE